jgi:hypothetical protein
VKDMNMNCNLMKSHDCHVLMTTLLPVALRGIELVCDAVTSLCLFLNAIEQKVINEKKTIRLREEAFRHPIVGILDRQPTKGSTRGRRMWPH